MSRIRQAEDFPWGRCVGLLVACAATIAGALQGTSPAHLLFRVTVSGLVAGLAVRWFSRLVITAARSR